MKPLLSVVAPMFNEELVVRDFIAVQLETHKAISEKYDLELVFVDDGSVDSTLSEMRKAQLDFPDTVSIVTLTRNFGLEGAIHAGLQMASGDAVVVMDADMQDPPSVILSMIEHFEAGADVVVASRSTRKSDSWMKRTGATIYYAVLERIRGRLDVDKDAANFRLLSKRAVEELLRIHERNGIFRISVPFIGMHKVTVKYSRENRLAGKTKFKIGSMLRFGLDSVTSLSLAPLRATPILLSTFSLLASFISVLGIFFAPEPWPLLLSTWSVLFFLFGVLFIALSVMSEYLSQAITVTRGLPSSIVYNFEASLSAKERSAKNGIQ
jgi:glycosyltransferase involved in cell wall biosynthesis